MKDSEKDFIFIRELYERFFISEIQSLTVSQKNNLFSFNSYISKNI